MIFRALSRKHKKLFIMHKLLIFGGILAAIAVAMVIQKISLPTKESKFSVPMGYGLLLFVAMMAMFNRVRMLFKVKFVGFALIFLILLFLRVVIDTLIVGIGLTLIPLIIDDTVISPYWKLVWWRDYER